MILVENVVGIMTGDGITIGTGIGTIGGIEKTDHRVWAT